MHLSSSVLAREAELGCVHHHLLHSRVSRFYHHYRLLIRVDIVQKQEDVIHAAYPTIEARLWTNRDRSLHPDYM